MRKGAWGLLLAVACEVPVEGASGDADDPSTDASTSATTELASTSATDDTSAPGSTGSGEADDAPLPDLGDDETTGGVGDAQCKDGVVVPGELCLAPAYAYPVVAAPRSLAVADIDEDGALDIVVGSNTSPAITVLRGEGDGGFGTPEVFVGAATRTNFVVLTQLDDDTRPDLLVVDADTGSIHAHLGFDSAFQASVVTDVKVAVTSVAVADVDADGRTDVAVTTNNGALAIYGGLGFGAFFERVTLPAVPSVRDLALGDVDQNGWLDLVTANGTADTASIVYNLAAMFTPALEPLTAGADPRAVAMGDVDEDGWLDIVLANFGGDVVTIRLAAPMAGFVDEPILIPVDDQPSSVLVRDLDGDGHVDLAVTQQAMVDALGIHLGRGDGTFAEPVLHDVGDDPNAIAAGDFDRDGAPDLAVINLRSNDLFVLLSDP